MPVNLTLARQEADQLIAFADGYEEATALLFATLVGAHGLTGYDISTASRRMRSVARSLLLLTDECEGYRVALAESRGGTQGRLTDGLD